MENGALILLIMFSMITFLTCVKHVSPSGKGLEIENILSAQMWMPNNV